MNGVRPNRRQHAYRAGQLPRDLTEDEKQELSSDKYWMPANANGRSEARVPPFKESGIPYTKNYLQNKEQFDAFRKARMEMKPTVWPRASNGGRMIWEDTRVGDNPSGRAHSVAEAKKMHMFYPHQGYAGGLVVSAPFSKGEKSFIWEKCDDGINDEVPAVKAFGVPEIMQNIMKHLSYPDISALQRSGTAMGNHVMGVPALWDMSRAQCNYSEFTAEEFAILKQKGQAAEDARQGNNEFVMVSQTHLGYEKEFCRQILPNNTTLLRGLVSLCGSVSFVGNSIRRICFNRVPFFDPGVFATVLDKMPNLERVDITSCDLIRFHHVPALLDIVHEHNKKNGFKLLLDVAPRYHTGALWENSRDDNAREGTFGLTYSNPGVKIPPAVAKTFIYDIYPRLRKYGQMHMLWDNALFRQYLEKLPLYSKSVVRMEAIAEYKYNNRSAKGGVSKKDQVTPIGRDFAELVTIFGNEAWLQMYGDGAVSCSHQATAENFDVWGILEKCIKCHTELMLMYFTTGFVCDSCHMNSVADSEPYGFTALKKRATGFLQCGPPSGPMVPMEETSMDFSLHRNAADGTTRITEMDDFDKINENENPKLRTAFNFVHFMDQNKDVGLCIPDLQAQRKHPYDRMMTPRDGPQDQMAFASYRKPLTLEEIQKVPKGRVYDTVGHF
ncbi:hypothetical protein Daus18300_013787 [Diaporthe australafricana]|uniref:F-box domain-containing protein n=1 Tax=Diaporthe australafricana TaxID=127596 RepID=A0ABR3VXW6_9PEZI